MALEPLSWSARRGYCGIAWWIDGEGDRDDARIAFQNPRHGAATWLWIGLIGVASIALSRALACVTPFAALATLAAFTLPRREAAGVVLFVWLANQVVGFGLLHYPWTGSTIARGVAIGVAALGGLIAAWEVGRSRLATWIPLPAALAAAFAAYEAVLLGASLVLLSGPGVFAATIMVRILAVNAAAAGILFGAHRVAGWAGWSIGRAASV